MTDPEYGTMFRHRTDLARYEREKKKGITYTKCGLVLADETGRVLARPAPWAVPCPVCEPPRK